MLTTVSGRAHSLPVAAPSATGFGDPSKPKAHKRRNGAFLLRIAQPVYGGRVGRASARPGLLWSPVRQPGTSRHPHRLATIGGGSPDQRSQP